MEFKPSDAAWIKIDPFELELLVEEALIKIKRGFETTKKNGTGMGLVIVSEIVSNAKGRIDFVPSKDRGLLVKITFPLDRHEQKN